MKQMFHKYTKHSIPILLWQYSMQGKGSKIHMLLINQINLLAAMQEIIQLVPLKWTQSVKWPCIYAILIWLKKSF